MFEGLEKNDVDNHIRPELTYKLVRDGAGWKSTVQFVVLKEAAQ
jgi:hypothetical protein